MFMLSKEFRFEASHILPNHDGKCSRLHGHSWKGKVFVQGEELETKGPKVGMVMDFADIGKAVKQMTDEKLDHCHLNESLDLENPTSEMICLWIYNHLKPILPNLAGVEIEETCTSCCSYFPGWSEQSN